MFELVSPGKIKTSLMGIFKNIAIFYMSLQLRTAFRTGSDGNLANHLKEASQFDAEY